MPSLAPPWLLAATDGALLALGPATVLELALPARRPDLARLVDALATGVDAVRPSPGIDDGDLRELLDALRQAGALTDAPSRLPPTPLPALRDVLLDVRRGGGATSCATADEALVLPVDTPPRTARRALHGFVAGLQPEARATAYAGLLEWGDGCAGDVPVVVVDVDALAPDEIHVVRLVDGDVTSLSIEALDALGADRAHRLGPIQEIRPAQPIVLGARQVHSVVARYTSANLRFPRQRWAHGAAADAVQAELVARAEGAERHALGRVSAVTLRRARASEVAGAVDPVALWPPNDRQAAAHGVAVDDEPRLWVEGRTLDGDERWVPAAAVLMPFADPARPEPWLSTSSSGAAAHLTVDAAVDTAVRELIERDALMWRWVQQVAPDRIVEDGLGGDVRETLSAVRALGWDVRLLDLTLDLLPVVLCAMRRPGRLALGMSCAWSVEGAAAKALDECAALGVVGRAVEPIEDPTSVAEPLEHIALHLHERWAPSHAFLLDPPTWIAPADVPVTAAPLAEVLAPMGEAVVVDLSSDHVRPFRVVRAVVPGLVPITFRYDGEPLGHPRLASPVVRADGRRLGRVLDLRTVGPIVPHPFP